MTEMDIFTKEQLEEKGQDSIPFPIYFSKDPESEDIIQILAITDIGPIGSMGVPEYIELEKHLPSGMLTTAHYILVDSFKAHESKFSVEPEHN